MRRYDWVWTVAILAFVGAVVFIVRGQVWWGLALLGVAMTGDIAGRVSSRRKPAPLPATLRWVLHTPHPSRPLRRALQPVSGERVLEVGPGLGQYAVQVAQSVGPQGHVDVLDVQQAMLDATLRRAQQNGVDNISPALVEPSGRFPYDDATFDAAYLNSVLGEIPDQRLVLSELRRVLKPDGRIVVGEIGLDPDFVSLRRLQHMCDEAGLQFDRRVGPKLAYFARFVPT